MARSLARPAPSVLVALHAAPPRRRLAVVGGQRAELTREVLDARFHRGGPAVAQPQDAAAHQAQNNRDTEIDEVAHLATSVIGWDADDQSSPPFQRSRFQIGTVAFNE